MEQLSLQHQAHYFCDNSDLSATPTNIGRLLTCLSELGLIPNTGDEIHAQTGMQNKFVIMLSTTEKFQIQFPNQEIVFLGQDMDHESFMARVNQAMDLLAKEFPDKKANRLSILVNDIKRGNEAEYNDVYKSLVANVSDPQPVEWDYRTVHRKLLTGTSETINSIVAIRRCEVQRYNEVKDSLSYDIDCNTIYQSQMYRFDFNNSRTIFQALSNEVSEQLARLNSGV
ncbi:TPA: hypothetical protein ACX3EK_000193 [Vibrio parahaemolyticus]|uniref:hypothetical protein n=1 Tax=Vibrio harveyi group TaxID=717610 RepID=UPI000425DAC5|nr:hypothetical protein [Vibrio parahaemolyticus]MBE3937873.1 hypothetical protein [Vibrio parahaemolyticus]MBE5192706.1 hypothetical protein [Vibrio parahaemolyticus]MBM4797016.1 hypothetical protein [Vibrio parahaemolyticus]MBM4960143.1 hypothetical protein [Vibrio parahaemolyticus]MDF5373324.1 hypothetical protein [Vibrio parahaemolyticus]